MKLKPQTEEFIKSKGGHFGKLKQVSITKKTFRWRGLKFNRGHGPLASLLAPPITKPCRPMTVSSSQDLTDKPAIWYLFQLMIYAHFMLHCLSQASQCFCPRALRDQIALDLLYKLLNTVDREKFAELNICGFCAIEVFAEMFLSCLGHKYSLCSIIKERHLYLRKNFLILLKTVKNTKVQPSKFFFIYSSPLFSCSWHLASSTVISQTT